ncbi:MAG: hypothetical protein ACRDOS_07205 [Gaiellaceae bacterium]
MGDEEAFDPRGLLAALDRNYVAYVLIGGLARVIRGTDEITNGVDVCPSSRSDSVERLGKALEELEGRRADRRRLSVDEEALASERITRLRTRFGDLNLVAEPAGTRRGFDDLRRGATREHIGQGLRPRVASVADLARMSAARAHELGEEPGREAERLRVLEVERSRELRRIMEAEVGLQRTLGISRDIGIDM